MCRPLMLHLFVLVLLALVALFNILSGKVLPKSTSGCRMPARDREVLSRGRYIDVQKPSALG